MQGKKYYGRFNQGVVTINLPDVALSSNGDEQKFWKIFEERLELCHKALQYRHKRLLNTKKYQDLLNIKINGKTVRDILDSFELENNDLLNAANAYTSLIHFDEMLVDSLGDSIGIKQG